MDPTVITALIGLAGVALTAWLGRRRNSAEVQQITATAHTEIYEAYRGLLDEIRDSAELAAEEARQARHRARRAEQRAAEAELAAEIAADQAREAIRLLAELRPLIARYVPGADESWLPRVDQVVAAASS